MLATVELSGVCLRNRRQLLGLTQVGLAQVLGVTANTVARWERGVQGIANPERALAAIGELARSRPKTTDDRVSNTMAARRDNLPAPLNHFVGRGAELGDLQRLLGKSRLVTLTGAAGIGKTRLALEFASTLVGQYPDGVWLVELAPIADHQLSVQAIASAVCVADEFDRPLIDTLERVVRDRQLLLVLDNCEHLQPGLTPLVMRLLRASRRSCVVSTSREPLGIAGETVWRVPPLATTRSGAAGTAEPDSVRLFVERAQSANPNFKLTATNERAVQQICERLDGMPLAIELAAATAMFLAPQQLLDRISTDQTGPAGTLGSAMEWQHPMTTTIQRSVDLLTHGERRLYARLAVFVGGFSLEAAQAVCGGPVVDLLRSLVLKSLVIADLSPSGVMRYRLLEPLREFAGGLLRCSEIEARATARAHVRFYLEMSRDSNLALAASAGGRWWPVLNQEHDNLHTALRWLEQADESADAQLVGTAIAEVWRVRGHVGKAREFLARFGAARQAAESSPGVLLLGGQLAYFQGDFTAARGLLEECVARTHRQGLWPGLARALVRLADVERAQGNFDSARLRVHEAVATCPAGRDDDEFQASLHLYQALIDLDEMRIEPACALAERCLPLLQRGGFVRVEAQALMVLAVCASWRGRHARAIRLLEQSLEKWQAGDRWGAARTLLELGRTTIAAGDTDAAAAYIARSLHVCRELGDPWGAAAALEASATLAARAGRGERAVRLIAAAAGVRERVQVVESPRERLWLAAHIDVNLRARWASLYAAAHQAGRGMTIAQAVELALDDERRDQRTGLTRREREVARLVASAKTNREIADELVIAVPTAERHVTNILHKLHLKSRAQVVLWAAETTGRADAR